MPLFAIKVGCFVFFLGFLFFSFFPVWEFLNTFLHLLKNQRQITQGCYRGLHSSFPLDSLCPRLYLRHSYTSAQWPQMLDTAEWPLIATVQKKDTSALIQLGYIPDQTRLDSQLQPRNVAPLFHATLQAALLYQTVYASASFITTRLITIGKVKGEEELG